jgi:pimeloyl-ACP methyl ester carboxylesterase
LFFFGLFHIQLHAEGPKPESELLKRLRALTGVVEVRETRFDSALFKEAYEVMIEQPLDHQNPSSERFRQRFFISHLAYDKPVLLETEGYAAYRNQSGELARILGGNQVIIEHRFFGRSVPSPLNWGYLTVKQAADDLHRIVTALKALYTGKWVSTGGSKGGQTALFYKCRYPDDVDASVAYSAPINIAQEDPRIDQFLQTVGDEATRTRIRNYQLSLLKREDEILPLVKEQAQQMKWTFTMGLSEAYEYAVLEYPYAFWQYGSVKPSNIPSPDAPADRLFEHFSKINTIFFYSDQGQKAFEPALYQAFTELGYYNYDITDFQSCLKTLKNPTNLVLCPANTAIVYNPSTMQNIYHFLQYKGDNIIYIYGELDTWAATAIQLIGRTNAVKIVVKNGHHGSGIHDFTPDQKEVFYTNLEKWLGQKLAHLI